MKNLKKLTISTLFAASIGIAAASAQESAGGMIDYPSVTNTAPAAQTVPAPAARLSSQVGSFRTRFAPANAENGQDNVLAGGGDGGAH